jgi:hypothetical protein
VSTPVTNYSFDFGAKGTQTVSELDIPLVPLNLECQLWSQHSEVSIGSGLIGVRNGYLTSTGTAHVDPGNPSTQTGYVSVVEFDDVTVTGDVTVFTCSLSGSTCTITDTYDGTVDASTEKLQISAGQLSINSGDVIGYWFPATGGGQLKCNDDTGTAAMSAASAKPVSGDITGLATDSIFLNGAGIVYY